MKKINLECSLSFGKFMDKLTPIEKAKQLGIYNIDMMSIFPTIILQDHYPMISNINK